jgi:polysaccharide chain length determinant protein (PEP-CTERM system associated)
MEVTVERMRLDIEIKVIAGNNAFTVSYVGKDPAVVMNVTNTLASLFIEENLRLREQQAEGTSEFLAGEHAVAKRELEKLERTLKEFKEQHMGALPEQMDANLHTLDRLQVELQTVSDAIKNAEDRRIVYERQLADYEKQLSALKLGVMPDTGGVSISAKLERLKEELTRLQAEFNENYPDILLLKKQIHELEEQPVQVKITAAPSRPSASSVAQTAGSTLLGQIQATRLQVQTINAEIDSLRQRQRRTIGSIKEYEKRVEDTFSNQQMLLNLTRDYEMSQKAYQDLLQKRLSARISENLEKRQKAEQFRVVDPAKIPERPFKPDHRKIVLFGSLASVGSAAGLILLRDYINSSFRESGDFDGTVNLPVLASIPMNKIIQKKGRPPIVSQEPNSLMVDQYRLLCTRIHQLSLGNSQTIFAISSSTENEGKTVTALNLALTAARDFRKKTLLIDGDLRKPALSTYLQVKPKIDLLAVLSNKSDLQSGLLNFGHENLSVLPFVNSIGNSSSLLSSPEMRSLILLLKQTYDFILIDCPPILMLPDMHILEKLVDGIFLVVRAEKTRREDVIMAMNSLSTDKLMGIILNDVKQSVSHYYRYSYNRA